MTDIYLLAIYPTLQTAERTISQLLASGYNTDQLGAACSMIYGEPVRGITSDVTNKEVNVYAGMLRQMVGNWDTSKKVHVAGIGSLIISGVLLELAEAPNHLESALGTIGVPRQRIELMLESLRQGDAIICARVPQDGVENVSSILCQYKPVDIVARVRQWRMRGWRGFDAMSDPYSTEEIARKKRQYVPPRPDDVEACVDHVLQLYRIRTTQDT